MMKSRGKLVEAFGQMAAMALGFGVLVADVPVFRHRLIGLNPTHGDRIILWTGIVPACLGFLGMIVYGVAYHFSPIVRAGAESKPKIRSTTTRWQWLGAIVVTLGVATLVCFAVR